MIKKTFLILSAVVLISLFFNLYKKDTAPLCFNADEASFGYNAYSIAQTAKDEYGNFLPLRLKSFGDFKMPLYTYLSVPFIKAFGVSENSTRALNVLVAALLPIAVYFLSKEIFARQSIAILSAFLAATSVGLNIVGRHAHEGYLSVLLLALATLFFLKNLKSVNFKNTLWFSLFLLLSLFSYHSARIFALFYLGFSVVYFLKNKKGKFFIFSLIVVIGLFSITDIVFKPERVKNLLFFNNPGFSLKINELRSEQGPRLIYNKATVGIKDFLFEHLNYFSPQFLVSEGDQNIRFGFPGMSPITYIEYLFLFVGIYYLVKKRQKWAILILLTLIISPLPSSLSWHKSSITRSLFMFIPILMLSAYGVVNLFKEINKKYLIVVLSLMYFAFLFYSWDFYLNHYPKKALVARSWQCGYRELADYVKSNYNNFDNFYITRKNGQPYIFMLFYLKYPPEKYQKTASLSAPDEFGFGQVEGFDKFIFDFKSPLELKKTVVIGYPDDFTSMSDYSKLDASRIKKITIGNEEIFWIYETDYMKK